MFLAKGTGGTFLLGWKRGPLGFSRHCLSPSNHVPLNLLDVLLDEKAHLPAPTPIRRAERGRAAELTFQHYFFQDVHVVLLGDATQGCEL